MITKVLVSLFFVFNFYSLSAQFIYSKYVEGNMSQKQFIFTDLPGFRSSIIQNKEDKYDPYDPENFTFWEEYLEEYWYLTSDYKVLPFDEAYALAQEDVKNTYLVQLAKLDGGIYTFMRVMSPVSKKGQTAFSTILDYKVEPADLVYGLLSVQEVLLNKKNYPSKFIPKSAAAKNGKMLKNKTLYIGYYKSNKERKKIEESYPYSYKFVTLEEIDEAILNKEEDVLVIRQFQIPSLEMTPKFNFVVYSTSDGATVTQAIEGSLSKAIKAFTNSVN